jgi:enterobactin synthetase component D / holo-[acyl-carrier protein] synthase
MARTDEIQAFLADALGPRARIAVSTLDFGIADLLPEERALVARAVEKRQREFATGRVLARRLLASLGRPGVPLGQAQDRAPLWPVNVVGSISHTRDLCAVAVAERSDARSIGVDVEQRHPLKPELHAMVLRPAETRWITELPEADRGEHAMLFFSAKECTYKCQYPLTRLFLDFSDVELEIAPHRRFLARVLRDGARRDLEGSYFFAAETIVTAMIIPAHAR